MWLVTFLKFLVNKMENKITIKCDNDIRTQSIQTPANIVYSQPCHNEYLTYQPEILMTMNDCSDKRSITVYNSEEWLREGPIYQYRELRRALNLNKI